jgi:NAD(P)H-dependent flavin oxidoreductase YrpB (nitropropane dioxygenase family)
VKVSAIIEDWDAATLREYGKLCAWALAKAHARSGDAAMIAGYLGTSAAFDDAITEFAVEYADQNQRDYRAFIKAVREGRLNAITDL